MWCHGRGTDTDETLQGLERSKEDGVIDARGVFDSVIDDPVKTLNDKQLLIHALAFREHLEDLSVDQLYWFDWP